MQDTMAFCLDEFRRLHISNPALKQMTIERSSAFIYHKSGSIPTLLSTVEEHLKNRRAFSLIRVGNGEGNAFSMTQPRSHPALFETFCHEFNGQNHFPISEQVAEQFCKRVVIAIDNADWRGVRSFRMNELKLIPEVIEKKSAYAALGLTYARDYLRQSLEGDALRNTIITSAWIHLDLVDEFDALLALGREIIVITGRHELHHIFKEKLGNRLIDFIPVPVQRYIPESFEESHFGGRFDEVCSILSKDLSGKLVLVGAGLFGKIYCDVAKRHGAVALDLGSLFDVLSGKTTRPIFKDYNFRGKRWV